MSFKGFIKTNYLRFIYINILSVISGIAAIGAGYIQMYWLTYIKDRAWVKILLATALMGILYLAAQGMIYYIQFVIRVQEEEYNKKVRARLATHYFRDGQNHQVPAVQNRMTNDLEMIRKNYFDWYPIVPFYGSMFVAALVALLTINWSIFLTSVVIDIVSYFVPKLVQKKMEQATNNVSEQNKHYLDVLAKWFSGLEELRRYFAGAKLFQVGEKTSSKVEQAHVKQTAAQQQLIILNGICNMVGQIILLSLTAFLITKNLVIFGAIMSVQNFAANISIGLQQTIQALSFMKSSQDLMKQVDGDATVIEKVKAGQEETPVAFSTKDLALQYPNGEKLTFPDIAVKPGEKILLTGDSGAGKSTLFKLILGELKPSTGKIEFQNSQGLTIKPNMSRIGYIPQEPNLFPGTIKENITMFNKQLNDQVARVLDEVNFAADIKKFKAGLDEKIDLDNLNISGGQRQKIVLARSKIHGSDIILIDEVTSAIDQTATMNILQKLLKSKATIVFIAHNFNKKMQQMFDREIHLIKE